MIQAHNRTVWGQPVSFFHLEGAQNLTEAIQTLPRAESRKVFIPSGNGLYDEAKNFQAIVVTENDGKQTIVNCPTKQYKHIQHDVALEPITEGMKLAGLSKFRFVLYYNAKFAKLQVYTQENGYDSVCLGFSVINSFDSTSALKYGVRMDRKHQTMELVGYRQTCANGMKIKVPLDQADIIKQEIVEKVQTLIAGQERILHTKSAEDKIARIQYVVEALSLMHKPVEAYIKKAQDWKIEDNKKLMQLIKLHVGERYAERVAQRYMRDTDKEGRSLWSLYNAITFVSSHEPDLKVVSRENLIDKAADMLNSELFPQIEVLQ
jgi:hypothetical protein